MEWETNVFIIDLSNSFTHLFIQFSAASHIPILKYGVILKVAYFNMLEAFGPVKFVDPFCSNLKPSLVLNCFFEVHYRSPELFSESAVLQMKTFRLNKNWDEFAKGSKFSCVKISISQARLISQMFPDFWLWTFPSHLKLEVSIAMFDIIWYRVSDSHSSGGSFGPVNNWKVYGYKTEKKFFWLSRIWAC